VAGPGAVGQQGGDGEEGMLRTAVFHLKKLVNAGLITKEQAEALLQELLRIYRADKPVFRGSPAQQTNQHLALIQKGVISLMTKTVLAGLSPAEQERIAKAVAEELGNPDYRTFDLQKLIERIRTAIIAQAAKSKQPASSPPKAGNAPAQPTAGGASPTPSGAGQGGNGSGGSGGGPPVAQGPNPRPDGEDDDDSVNPTGQLHHPISKRVHDAIEKHPKLKGKYKYRDPRITSRAVDKAAHNGYEDWHRKLDEEVANWIGNHKKATPKEFEAWLRWRYSQPDVKARFPQGF
jgi:hypothetical protein